MLTFDDIRAADCDLQTKLCIYCFRNLSRWEVLMAKSVVAYTSLLFCTLILHFGSSALQVWFQSSASHLCCSSSKPNVFQSCWLQIYIVFEPDICLCELCALDLPSKINNIILSINLQLLKRNKLNIKQFVSKYLYFLFCHQKNFLFWLNFMI